jgi:N-acetylglucosaminyldiphosphoundecaprenol N-acetyl-beta-D-mannosaminyltransferase
MSKANILGVHIDAVRVEDVLQKIEAVLSANGRAIIAHTHVNGINIACEQEWFRQFLNQADMTTCDGMGVKLGARFLGYHLPQRFTLADWMYQLAPFAAERGYSFFFLGNPPGAAEKAAGRLCKRYPGLKIVGAYHGFFNKTPGHPENEAVRQQINAARPNILFVGFGMPAQERWLLENWDGLQANIAMTCGALYEYLAGDLKRGPHWMTEHYLEWLARFFISPERYWKRYLHDNPVFAYRIIKQRFFGNVT